MHNHDHMSDDSFAGYDEYQEYDAALFGAALNQVRMTEEEES